MALPKGTHFVINVRGDNAHSFPTLNNTIFTVPNGINPAFIKDNLREMFQQDEPREEKGVVQTLQNRAVVFTPRTEADTSTIPEVMLIAGHLAPQSAVQEEPKPEPIGAFVPSFVGPLVLATDEGKVSFSYDDLRAYGFMAVGGQTAKIFADDIAFMAKQTTHATTEKRLAVMIRMGYAVVEATNANVTQTEQPIDFGGIIDADTTDYHDAKQGASVARMPHEQVEAPEGPVEVKPTNVDITNE